MLRHKGLTAFAEQHAIPMITIAELREWRRRRSEHITAPVVPKMSGHAVERSGQSTLPTEAGTFHAIAYRSADGGVEHLALVMGDLSATDAPLVRIHSECLTGDIAGSLRCDCGNQFQLSLSAIADEGTGVLIYLRGHEGRGIGLGNKLRAYQLQQHEGLDTVDANVSLGLPIDSRSYGSAGSILDDLGVRAVRLLTNNPDKIDALSDLGITVVERLALETVPTEHNLRYLTAKRDRLGHRLQRLG
jgi:GTP cyclohydrolase II/3,4-dihydroxy 2-butanone 4-phosphate synthase/GTP cyclohydrolase II